MAYIQRLATTADIEAIALLWKNFAYQRAKVNPSMKVKPNFDFKQYVTRQLQKLNAYCFVLEYNNSNTTKTKTIVGFLHTYVYDEAPPPQLPSHLLEEYQWQTPFLPRRVGTVLALYVSQRHRQGKAIVQLIRAAILKARELKVTDIDLLISEDQGNLQKFLEKNGFTKAATAYTKHYQISTDTLLPSLHPSHPKLAQRENLSPEAIPLRDSKTNNKFR